MINVSKKYVFVALLIAISILLLTFGCVYVVRSQTAYADYESDYLNNPQAVVNFNQIFNFGNYTQTDNGVKWVTTANNPLVTLTINSRSDNMYTFNNGAMTFIQGHKYYIKISDDNVNVYVFGASRNNVIVVADNSQNLGLTINDVFENGTILKVYINIIDLTQMFGQNSEPDLEECQRIFTADYYSYNSGTPLMFNSLTSYSQGVADTYANLNFDLVNFSSWSSCYLYEPLCNSNAFLNKYIDYEVLNFPFLQFRGYLAIPMTKTLSAGSLIKFDLNPYPSMGGAGGDYLWIGCLYNDSFVPIAPLESSSLSEGVVPIGDDGNYYITMPFDSSTLILSVSDSSEYFDFFDVGKWTGDFMFYDSQLDISQIIQAAVEGAEYEKDEYYNNYYGQYGTGYNNIYNSGYQAGINAQLSEAGRHFYTFPQFLGALFDVPVKTITSLLDFEVLGFNLKNFFFSLITLAIVFAIIRFILVRTGDK